MSRLHSHSTLCNIMQRAMNSLKNCDNLDVLTRLETLGTFYSITKVVCKKGNDLTSQKKYSMQMQHSASSKRSVPIISTL